MSHQPIRWQICGLSDQWEVGDLTHSQVSWDIRPSLPRLSLYRVKTSYDASDTVRVVSSRVCSHHPCPSWSQSSLVPVRLCEWYQTSIQNVTISKPTVTLHVSAKCYFYWGSDLEKHFIFRLHTFRFPVNEWGHKGNGEKDIHNTYLFSNVLRRITQITHLPIWTVSNKNQDVSAQ